MNNKNKDIFKGISACPSMIAENINSDKSELSHWPIQLKLIKTSAQIFENANLLIAADCTAYACKDFHNDFIKGHVTTIGCPKLDDVEFYKKKLIEIFENNNIKSVKVVKMSVPCCSGISIIVKQALKEAKKDIPYSEVTIDVDGTLGLNCAAI
ncbi:hypothetical protein [Clostridium sp.]|uniref:hypothetical protein n=1 Tax=Clostridium sp. TaxID=1506 RepID=UPI0039F4C2B6